MILDKILKNLKTKKDKIAYTIYGKSYTYQELYSYVCNLYFLLIKENPKRNPVIVYGHKDIYMKATFLACSFAGMPYVPIDIGMTMNRMEAIIRQVKPQLLIGDFETKEVKNISQKQIEKIMLQENQLEIDKINLKPEDIYYIIFTSGSTGVPKGVKVTYQNVDSCIQWLRKITKVEEGVILNQAAFSFDLSVADLYLSLISQSEHFILEKQTQSNFKVLFEQLEKSNSTLAVMTPSFADFLLLDKTFNKTLMPNLKTILFCGEKLLNTTVKKLYNRFENITIINAYGPTECTFAVTSITIDKNMTEKENIPIGKVKDDVEIVIVDENQKPLKDGEIGEILIVGESVADGYLETENKEKPSNNFIQYHHKKAYLTGDLGFIKKGILYYECRKDKQIKYKGYRIEIADIEKNLYSIEDIEKAVVIPKLSKENKVIRLLAFVKLKENSNKSY